MRKRILGAAVLVLIAGCSSGGGKTAAPTTTAPPTVALAALDGLLLTPAEINNAMGASNMTVTDSFDSVAPNSSKLSDEKCRAINAAADNANYVGSGWTANRGQVLQSPGDTPTHYADQEVVLFPAAKDAAAFFAVSSQSWASCTNMQFTFTKGATQSGSWNVGALNKTDDTLSITKTMPNGSGWSCQRALTVTKNLVVDTQACSYNADNTAVNIAHQIAAKVGKL